MTTKHPPHVIAFAYYVAGQATADWLIGENPRAIFRWDTLKKITPMLNDRFRLARLGTTFGKLRSAEESNLEDVRPIVLEQAFVLLAGLAAINTTEEEDADLKDMNRPFTLTDISKASQLLRPICLSHADSVHLAYFVLWEINKLFYNERLELCIQELASQVLDEGEVTDEDGSLRAHFARHVYDCRACEGESLIRWPSAGVDMIAEKPWDDLPVLRKKRAA